jgi:hypothetical protein
VVSFMFRPLYPWYSFPLYLVYGILNESQSRFGRYREVPLPGIDLRFLGHLACSLVGVQTEISRSQKSLCKTYTALFPILLSVSIDKDVEERREWRPTLRPPTKENRQFISLSVGQNFPLNNVMYSSFLRGRPVQETNYTELGQQAIT